jgi:hypothetical protein
MSVPGHINFLLHVCLTSIPTCRKTLRAEKINRYFDFKYLKICAHLNIFYNFL